jgi:Zn finger protein HypA/HybF involved in hydrogenase expression
MQEEIKIICPDCKISCEKITGYETIFECPKCNNKYTIKDGSKTEIIRFKAEKQPIIKEAKK